MDYFFVIIIYLAVVIGVVIARRNEAIGTKAMRWTLGFLIAGPALATLFIVLGNSVGGPSESTVALGFVIIGAAAIVVVASVIASIIAMTIGIVVQRGRRRRSLGSVDSRQKL